MAMAATHTEADTTTITIGDQIIMETMTEVTAMVAMAHGEEVMDTVVWDTAMEDMDTGDTVADMAVDTAMAEATECMTGIETNEDLHNR